MENKRVQKLVKNTSILTIGSFSSKIVVFFLVPFYTGILSTEEYGLYDLSITTIQLLMPILTINIIDSILRFALDNNDIASIRKVAFRYICIGTIIFSLGAIICRLFDFFPKYNEFYLYIVLYFIAYTLNAYFLQVAKGCDRLKTIAVAGVIGTIVLCCACIFLLKYTNLGLKGFYISNILGQLSPLLVYLIYLRKIKTGWNSNFDPGLATRMRKYSIPLILTAIGWWVNSSSDKYVVTLMCGVAANGLLSISYKIPNILSVLSGIFNQAWQISAIQEYKDDTKNDYYNKIVTTIMTGTIFFGMIIILLNRPLSRLLFAKDFYDAWKYVPFLIISSVFNVASGLFAPILAAQYKTKPIAISSFLGLASNIVLNFAFCYFWGVQGVTIATAFSSFLICMVRYYSAKAFFDPKTILIIVVSLGITCGLAICEIFEVSYVIMGGLVLLNIVVTYKVLLSIVLKIIRTVRNRTGI